MATKQIRVLHIDTGKTWRGGQQQAFYLHKELVDKKIFSIMICNTNSKLSDRCKEAGLPSISVNMIGEADIIASFKIAKICKKEKINIVQCHSSHAQSIGLVAKYFYSKVKLLAVRRVDFHIRNNKLSLLKYNSNKVDKIICVSEAIKKILIEDKVKVEKLITIHDGIDINKFRRRDKDFDLRKIHSIDKNHIIVGTVAAFVGHKDYPNLINAAKIVLDKIKNVTFLFVGVGPLKTEIENLVVNFGLINKIIFTGFRENIKDYLLGFDIFVLSSKLEGLGTSILDAQASGVPVIATNTGGIPEIIENNTNGILVEPENNSKLAYAIIDLIVNSSKREYISKNARVSVNTFSIENNVNKYVNLYEGMLGG